MEDPTLPPSSILETIIPTTRIHVPHGVPCTPCWIGLVELTRNFGGRLIMVCKCRVIIFCPTERESLSHLHLHLRLFLTYHRSYFFSFKNFPPQRLFLPRSIQTALLYRDIVMPEECGPVGKCSFCSFIQICDYLT